MLMIWRVICVESVVMSSILVGIRVNKRLIVEKVEYYTEVKMQVWMIVEKEKGLTSGDEIYLSLLSAKRNRWRWQTEIEIKKYELTEVK